MDTAGSIATSETYYQGAKANSILIRPEDGDIRVFSKATPTSTLGTLLKNGTMYYFAGIDFTSFNLIRTSGSVACTVQLGLSLAGESSFAAAVDASAAAASLTVVGGGVEATALRVTIASDSTGLLSVDDNGGSLTVDGTVTADTELPAAAALGDATANPTTTSVGAEIMGFNGTTWDRTRSGQTANSATVTGFENDLPMARYNAAPTARTEGQFGNFQQDVNGALSVNILPPNLITATSGNVANSNAVATLAAAAGKTTYISGCEITASGATVGAVVTPTIAGVITGTMSYTFTAPAGSVLNATPLLLSFVPAIPASATNTTIVVTLPALGAGNTNATVSAHGYQI